MKVKLKSANGFTRFMLAHGEKIGIAAVLTVALLLIWKSFGRERLGPDREPTDLASKADNAERHVADMSYERIKAAAPAEVVDSTVFDAVATAGIRTPVKEPDFPRLPRINPPVLDPIALRTDPNLLPPQELEVNASSGLWAEADPQLIKRMMDLLEEQQREQREQEEQQRRMEEEQDERRGGRRMGREEGMGRESFGRYAGGASGLEMTEDGVALMRTGSGAQTQGFEAIVNKSWVTVLAKVPIGVQVDEYEDALANARNYQQQYDMPEYLGYVVQRAEITEDGQSEWQTLPNIGKRTIINAMERRPIVPPEVVDPKYTHPILTYPLPPMVLRSWGEDVTHSDLPLPDPAEMYGGAVEEEKQPDDEPEDPSAGDDFAEQMKRDAPQMSDGYAGRGYPMGPMGPEGMGMRGGAYRGGMEMGRGMMGGMGYAEMGRGMMGGMGYGEMGRGAGGYEQLQPYTWNGQKSILFRFFDSSVQPGGRYRYRVRLALADVNKSTANRFIAPGDLDPTVHARMQEDKSPFRLTDWSDPSPIANVPQPGLIYVAQPKLSASPAVESSLQVLIKTLDAAHAAEVALAESFTRGSVMNLMRQKAQVIWSDSYDPQEDDQRVSPPFNFITGLTLLDFTGGEALNRNRDLPAPARALVMDSSGRMSVRRELRDQPSVKMYNKIIEVSKQVARDRQEDERGGRGRGGERSGRRGR